jgi:hypothetical protein
LVGGGAKCDVVLHQGDSAKGAEQGFEKR